MRSARRPARAHAHAPHRPSPARTPDSAALEKRAAEFNIILEDVSITHLMFSKEFTTAIESKQVAQQEAERSKFVVMKSEQERQAAIIRATSEAQAAELVSQAFRTSGSALIEIRRLEAAVEVAENLSKNKQVTYMPGGSNMIMSVNAGGRPAL